MMNPCVKTGCHWRTAGMVATHTGDLFFIDGRWVMKGIPRGVSLAKPHVELEIDGSELRWRHGKYEAAVVNLTAVSEEFRRHINAGHYAPLWPSIANLPTIQGGACNSSE